MMKKATERMRNHLGKVETELGRNPKRIAMDLKTHDVSRVVIDGVSTQSTLDTILGHRVR